MKVTPNGRPSGVKPAGTAAKEARAAAPSRGTADELVSAAAPEFAAALKRQLETMPDAVLDYKGLAACRGRLTDLLG